MSNFYNVYWETYDHKVLKVQWWTEIIRRHRWKRNHSVINYCEEISKGRWQPQCDSFPSLQRKTQTFKSCGCITLTTQKSVEQSMKISKVPESNTHTCTQQKESKIVGPTLDFRFWKALGVLCWILPWSTAGNHGHLYKTNMADYEGQSRRWPAKDLEKRGTIGVSSSCLLFAYISPAEAGNLETPPVWIKMPPERPAVSLGTRKGAAHAGRVCFLFKGCSAPPHSQLHG